MAQQVIALVAWAQELNPYTLKVETEPAPTSCPQTSLMLAMAHTVTASIWFWVFFFSRQFHCVDKTGLKLTKIYLMSVGIKSVLQA